MEVGLKWNKSCVTSVIFLKMQIHQNKLQRVACQSLKTHKNGNTVIIYPTLVVPNLWDLLRSVKEDI